MNFNKKHVTIFLDPHSDVVHAQESVNIILSPSLYWVKKISLPVRYVREVLKLLPSIFEDMLPEGNYSYSAYRHSESKGGSSEFFVFAYEDKKILEVMSEKNIAISNVEGVYFAQSELQNLQGAVSINEAQSIYVKDDIVILVPCCWIEEKGDLDLSEIALSKHKIALQHFGHIVDSKSLYKIGSLLLVMILLLGVEIFITAQKSADIAELRDGLFSKYHLKETALQNRSMLKKYRSIHEKQTNLRTYMSYILSLKLKAGESVKEISFKDQTMSVSFEGVDKDNIGHITGGLSSAKIDFKTDYKSSTLHLEMNL